MMGTGLLAGKRSLPHGVKKVIGTEAVYRLRIGDYRLVYRVEQERAIVDIMLVGHRRDVYR